MAYLVYLALAVLLLLYTVFLVYRRVQFAAAFKFPGPRAWPIVGNSSLLLGSRSDFFRVCERLGKENPEGVFLLWVGMRPFVFLYKSSVLKPLLTSSTHLEKNLEYTLASDWLGNGLITSKDQEWFRQRKMLTPCFHFDILKQFSSPIWRHGRVLLDKISLLESSSVDFVPLAKLLALDIICETAMGIDVGTQANSEAEYPKAIERMSEILGHRFITPWMKSDLLFRLSPMGREYHKHLAKVHGFIKEIILKKKADMNKKTVLKNGKVEDVTKVNGVQKEVIKEVLDKKEEDDFDICKDCNKPTCRPDGFCDSKNPLTLLDCLLKISEEDPSVSEKEITDQVNTFMFAGHDTISCALSFILFVLGHHPEWQEAIVRELDENCPDILTVKPDTRHFLKEFPVLDRCIKEALRIYSPSPMVGRNLRSPLKTPAGTLPAGTTAIIYGHLLHRDPDVFAEPETFNPDRFLPENFTQDSFAYIPFSAGPRNCIGKTLANIELKIITAMILKMFRVRSLQTVTELDLCFEIVLTSPQGVLLQFIPRD